MKNEILIEPQGGLGNRMRVIASGLWLGDITKKKIKIVWALNMALNCPIEELFVPIANCEIIPKKLSYYLFRSKEQKPVLKKNVIGIINSLLAQDYTIIEDSGVISIKNQGNNVSDFFENYRIPYFRTCEEFGNLTHEFSRFVPLPDLAQKINQQSALFSPKTLGIHIRRTDHQIAIERSPTESFIRRIQTDIENDPDLNFFLATDDKQTEDLFKSIFGNKILTLEKDFSRKNKQGVRDALVEMYCLSNTAKIYGSFWSSFSDMAARIKGIPVEKIMKSGDA